MRMTLTTATLAGLLVSATALAEDAPMLSTSGKFDQASGEALFNQVCQGCHMAEGQGSHGAGPTRRWLPTRNWGPRCTRCIW